MLFQKTINTCLTPPPNYYVKNLIFFRFLRYCFNFFLIKIAQFDIYRRKYATKYMNIIYLFEPKCFTSTAFYHSSTSVKEYIIN